MPPLATIYSLSLPKQRINSFCQVQKLCDMRQELTSDDVRGHDLLLKRKVTDN